uniref:Ribosomal protein L6 n=1 Tax=Hepatozoon canis TaxID=110120 RepID=A0A3Q8TJJ7_9APIC|nr:ribosomal protein L6 [Hepatozoon canis]
MVTIYNNYTTNYTGKYYFWVIDYYDKYSYLSNKVYYILINNYNIYVKNLFPYILTILKTKKNNIKFIDILKFNKLYLNITNLTLKLTGLGYKVNTYNDDSSNLFISIGYSHRILLKLPKGVSYSINTEGTCFTVSSRNKVLLYDIVSKIKQLKRQDPYKGSGVRLLSDLFIPKSYKK